MDLKLTPPPEKRKISSMQTSGPLTGTETFEVVQLGVNRQLPLSQLSAFMQETLSSYHIALQNGYIGTHSDWVADLATVESVNNAVANMVTVDHLNSAVTNMATHEDVNNATAGMATMTDIQTAIANRATITDVNNAVADKTTIDDVNNAVPMAVDAYLENGDIVIDLGMLT